MNKETKVLISVVIITFLAIFGFAFLVGKANPPNVSVVSGDDIGLVLSPSFYDVGDVPIEGGNVVKKYEVKNSTDETIRLKKIATSCMCTKAKVKVNDNETKEFGMEGHGDSNPPVNMDIPPGVTAKVTAIFDPAAHGPQGVGAFDRIVYLTFSDPGGVVELKFNGTVVR